MSIKANSINEDIYDVIRKKARNLKANNICFRYRNRNRMMNQEIIYDVSEGCSYGFHHVCIVILPKQYRRILLQSNTTNDEQVYLLNSIATKREIPYGLKGELTKETIRIEQSLKGECTCIYPSLISNRSTFYDKAFMDQQNHNSCGYWTMHNAIMAVLTGSGEFYDILGRMHHLDHKQRYYAESHIRETLEDLIPMLRNDEGCLQKTYKLAEEVRGEINNVS